MRIELGLLVILASTALGALVESARRAASPRADEMPLAGPVPILRAALEHLERARAGLDDAGPRLLVVIAASSGISAVAIEVLACCTEVAAVLAAVGAGLAVPALRWSRELRADALALDARIRDVRASLDARERGVRSPAGARPRRS